MLGNIAIMFVTVIPLSSVFLKCNIYADTDCSPRQHYYGLAVTIDYMMDWRWYLYVMPSIVTPQFSTFLKILNENTNDNYFSLRFTNNRYSNIKMFYDMIIAKQGWLLMLFFSKNHCIKSLKSLLTKLKHFNLESCVV